MKLTYFVLVILSLNVAVHVCLAKVPEYHVDENGVHIKGVDSSNPIIYDNDWWTDVFDNYYLWIQTSLGKADLRGNIVTRDMWDNPKYLYTMEQCIDDCNKAIGFVRESGLKNIPDLTPGASLRLEVPDSGVIDDTETHDFYGSQLIIDEAQKASPEKPLLVMAGGPLTTIANALLLEPSIAENMIVFSLSTSNFGYNGKDGWSAYIVAKKTYLVEWATRGFWDKNSVLQPEDFASLPDNPMYNEMKRLINTDLGQANQMGDGSALLWLYNNQCWLGAEPLQARFDGKAVIYEQGDQADVLNIPKAQTNLPEMKKEFFEIIQSQELTQNE